ncbi:MAG: hypothetical protein U5K29_05115 [Acidimicrobiales bacterium]|nr:hypothetical protein [Acidimicrobiales bacterium]
MTSTNTRPMLSASRRGVLLVGACSGLGALSLLLPATLSFDPWAWLVWGREVGQLDLDTTGGPSWKPLPVLVTTMLAPLGPAAVSLWMLVARTGALLGLVATYRLAARFAGAPAGVIAAALLLLTPDGDPRFLRLVGEGHVAPLTIALALFAVEAHLDERRRTALTLGWGVALLRPEAWPLLGIYALWLWWRDPSTRVFVVAILASVPMLWFGGDWWGSGSPWHGADAARVAASESLGGRTASALTAAGAMVVAPAWVAAGFGLVTARRRGERVLLAVAAGALAWSALVAALAVTLGYAALSRFYLPAAAAVCVLAGVGVVCSLPSPGRVRMLWVVGIVVAVALAVPRAAGIGPVVVAVADRGVLEADLDVVIERSGGPEILTSCGDVSVTGSGLLRPAVAWKLDLPLHRVPRARVDHPGTMLLRSGSSPDRQMSLRSGAVVLARSSHWVAYAVDCPEAELHSFR